MYIWFWATLIVAFFANTSIHPASDVIILIHGTWAQKERWFMPGGSFFSALEESIDTKKTAIVSFLWPGGLGHGDRMHGAQSLAQLIKSYPRDTSLTIIAHSHGVTVGLLAADCLGAQKENYYRIQSFFALGAPVLKETCMPNMYAIERMYNLFSHEDFIQTIFGIAERTFISHKRIANLCVTIDGMQPGHTNMHSPLIAKWLFCVPDLLKESLFWAPGIIHFFSDSPPCYEKDINRYIKLFMHEEESLSM